MADTILEVGLGKAYSGVNGFIDAFNALPTDMNSVSGNVIIRLWPDYVYNWFPTSKTYNPSNPSASKKVIIEPANGYEHNGVFDTSPIIEWDSSGSVGRVNMYYDYFEMRDIQFRIGINHNAGIILFRIYGTTTKIERILIEHYNYYTYLFQYLGSGGGLFNNNIFWSLPGNGGGVYLLENYSTGTLEVNNNLAYGATFLLGNSSNVTAINNGSIQNGSYYGFQSYTGVNGYGNYVSTGGGIFGLNSLTLPVVDFKFRDPSSKDLRLRVDSPLISTGSENSINNPTAINREPWNGNHRSPYNNIVLYNVFQLPPEDVEYVRGNWENGLVLTFLAPGLHPSIGLQHLVQSSGQLIHNQIGPVNIAQKSMYYRGARNVSTKKMTISMLYKGPTTNTYSLLSDAALENGLSQVSTTQLQFKKGSFTATFSPSSVLNTSDYYSIVFCIDLEKSLNSDKFKVFLYQKGALYTPTISFSGSPPSLIEVNNWRVDGPDHQGITSIWDRSLSYEEIYNISYDPYVMYRNEKKLLLLTDVIKSGLGLWFLRKFIMGN